MSEPKKLTLPSGAELLITLAPFADSKALYQAFLEELKGMKIDEKADVDVNLLKDLMCAGFSSKKIEAALWKCLARATYNGQKISEETFEAAETRDDYFTICLEVAKENVLPFTKSLYAQYSHILGMLTPAKVPA